MAMSEGGARMLANNPHIRFYDGRRGYVRVTVTPDLWRSDFRMVPFVTRPGADVRTLASWIVEEGRPGARQD